LKINKLLNCILALKHYCAKLNKAVFNEVLLKERESFEMDLLLIYTQRGDFEAKERFCCK